MTLGLVCDTCDALSPITVSDCVACGEPLGILLRPDSIPPGRVRPISGSALATPAAASTEAAPPAARPSPVVLEPPPLPRVEEAAHAPDPPPAIPRFELPARPPAAQPPSLFAGREPPPSVATRPSSMMRAAAPNALAPPPPGIRRCPTCNDEMPFTHRFCGNCGHRFDGPATAARRVSKTQFLGSMQEARARLVLIKGEGIDGVSYHLAGADHVAGRSEGAIVFPEDRLLSPRHANFYYRDGALFVRDAGSINGVFLRIRGSAIVDPGQLFLVGEQLLVARAAMPTGPNPPDAEGTYFYGSPRRPARLHLVQVLTGGDIGLVVRCATSSVTIGREGNHVNFPDDPFISGHHAQVTALEDGRFKLDDLRSKNGTFVRIRGEAQLEHGDYVFLGQQLLRVELT